MSFGFGISDFLLVLDLCRNVYGTLKGAPAEYRECRSELNSVKIAIESLVSSADDPNSLLSRQGADRKEDLTSIVSNFRVPLEKLQALVNHHSRMEDHGSGQLVRVWERFRFGMTDLDAIRRKLNFHLLTINTFLVSLENFSMGSMERKLDKIYAMLKQTAVGNTMALDSSAMSIMSTRSSIILSEIDVQGEDAWEGLKEALRAEDISDLQITAHRDEIFQYVKSLLANDTSFDLTTAPSGIVQPAQEKSSTYTVIEVSQSPGDEKTEFPGLGIEIYEKSLTKGSWKTNELPLVTETEIPTSSFNSSTREAPILVCSDPTIPDSLEHLDTNPTVISNDLTVREAKKELSGPIDPKNLEIQTSSQHTEGVAHLPKYQTQPQVKTPEELVPYSPSTVSRTSSIFDTSRSPTQTESSFLTSPPTSRSPTLVPSASRALSARTSVSGAPGKKVKSSWASRKLTSFAQSFTAGPPGSVYENPYAAAYR